MATAAASVAGPPLLRRVAHRLRVAVAAFVAGVLGVAPHVLHHVGPLAGAALFAGLGGTLLFGAIGFALAIPTLLKIHRHTGGWRVPAAALAAMAAVFSISAFVIGPAITGGGESEPKATPATLSQPPATPAAPADGTGHAGHH